ncbi:hypothetical protein [Brevundimonas faecalis]|uniref:Lipoprotein n=1 Tax=Brevundimonas faecalis TaxID=947378 RepID=A0ABV2RBG5_9CAUL
MKSRVLAAAAAVLILGGCASTGRLLSYGVELSDALLRMGHAQFSIYVHPKDDTLLIQRRVMQTSNYDGQELIRIAAAQFLEPVDCTVTEVRLIAPGGWEAGFACPAGVDLRALVQQQRAALQTGAPLHP